MKHVLIVIALVTLSCKKTITPKNVITNTNAKCKAYCFYKLDDKYSIVNDSTTINNWLEKKSINLLNGDFSGDTFHQNGGGPNGSQWNPSTDLYIAILKTKNSKHQQLYINNTLQERRVFQQNEHITWYKTDVDYWQNALKTIDSTDLKLMFSEDIESNPIIPLNSGKVLKCDVVCDTQKLTSYFHATQGE